MTVGARVLGGRYRLGSVLGQGGMAVVYRAEDLTLGRTVAVKVLREQLGSEAEFLERFGREARAAARLNHPNIIAVYDVGQDAASNYIVMEYVEGVDLRDLIREEGPLAPARVVEIGCQIAAALEFAHRSGLIHRDIKSQNVLVTPDGKAKVADFGIAVALGERSITEAGMVIGSVHYMPPEQAEGRLTTPASDVYSLGVVLFEMATGRLPFTAESPIAVARLQLEARPPSPQSINPDVPPALSNVILACLEKEPTNRPASAALVAAALRGQRSVAAGAPAVVPGPGGTNRTARTTGTGRRNAAGAPGTERRPVPGGVGDAAYGPPTPHDPHLHTDILLPHERLVASSPVRPDRAGRAPRGKSGGSAFWPLFWVGLLVMALAAAGGWMLAGQRDVRRATPTLGPVVTATLPPAATVAPVATKPAAQPTTAPATPVPPTPAPPTQPPATVTAVPPTPVPPTQPPAKPTAPPGTVAAPGVVDKSEGDATKAIRDAGLTVKVEERRSLNAREGVVLEQNPSPGTRVLSGSTVTIVVGRGLNNGGGQGPAPGPKPAPKPGLVLVPNVEGMDEREARRTLEGQEFKVDVRKESSDRKGEVIDQNPGAGDSVRPGSVVRITIGT